MKDKIIAMLATHSVKEIIEETGVSQSQVYKIRRDLISQQLNGDSGRQKDLVRRVENKRCGDSHYRSKLSDEVFDKLYVRFLEGESIKALHEGLDISYQALAQRVRRRERIRGNKFIAMHIENKVEKVAEEISLGSGVVWSPINHEDMSDSYFITACGRVRSWKKELKVKDGVVAIRSGRYTVAKLVAMTFLPNPDGCPTVRYLDDDRSNYRLENLAWKYKKKADGFVYSRGNISVLRAKMIREDWSTGKFGFEALRVKHKRKEKEIRAVLNNLVAKVDGFDMFKSLSPELTDFVCDNYVYGELSIMEMYDRYDIPVEVMRLIEGETAPKTNKQLII